MKKYFTVATVAKILDRSDVAVRHLIRRGKLRGARAGGKLLISESELKRFLGQASE